MLYSPRFSFALSVRPEVLLSPILVRPVREQLEHDRVIRLLQAKYKRKSEVAINPGNQQTMPVGTGPSAWFPDLVLYASEKNRKVIGVVEVETAESVNNLEAMSQWAAFSRLKLPFHLYIPASYVDVARRLCQDLQITLPEIWTYQAIGEQIRFAMIQRGMYGEPKGRPAASAAAGHPKPEVVATAKPELAARETPEEKAEPAPDKAAASKPKPAAKPGARTAAKPAAKAAPRPAAPARRSAPAAARARKPVTPAKAASGSGTAARPANKTPASARSQKRR
jgi:hypothetical protein